MTKMRKKIRVTMRILTLIYAYGETYFYRCAQYIGGLYWIKPTMVSQKNIFRKRQVGKFNTASQNCIPKTGKTKEVRANLEQT